MIRLINIRHAFAIVGLIPVSASADIAACTPTTYSSAQISQAIQNSPNANSALKNASCAFGGIAMGESQGNGCSANRANTGVLQLHNNFVSAAGYTPTSYANLPLQQQVNIWAQQVGNSNTSGSYQTLLNANQNGTTVGGAPATSGMMAACFQFGPGVCARDVAYMQNNSGACPTAGSGGLNINQNPGTGNLDGNNQSICSWGKTNQPAINKNAQNCGAATIPTPAAPTPPRKINCPTPSAGAPGTAIPPTPASAPVSLPASLA